jgi:hypothetical protein
MNVLLDPLRPLIPNDQLPSNAMPNRNRNNMVNAKRVIRRSLLMGMYLQLCLCVISLHRDEWITKAAAFVAPSSFRIESRLSSRLVVETAATQDASSQYDLTSDVRVANGNEIKGINQPPHSPTDPCDDSIKSDTETCGEFMSSTNDTMIHHDTENNHHRDAAKTLSSHQQKSRPSPRPLPSLSRTHQSLLSKTSHMRRQRFVTGKYPLYVEVKQNPTKKWLGLAESRIYLNG